MQTRALTSPHLYNRKNGRPKLERNSCCRTHWQQMGVAVGIILILNLSRDNTKRKQHKCAPEFRL